MLKTKNINLEVVKKPTMNKEVKQKTGRNRFLDSIMEGQITEDAFKAVAESRGNTVTKATKRDDIKKHIDYYIENKNGRVASVDVKAKKRAFRGGERSSDIQWAEFKNVRGENGWMYGEAEYIAFEVDEAFLLFKRLDLLDYFTSKCSKESQNNPQAMPKKGKPREMYTPYRRVDYDRLDSVIMFPMSDIVNDVPHRIWDKV